MSCRKPKPTTEQIWRELSDRLRQFVRSRVPSACDVDDILQNVFLRIHQKRDDLRRVERLEAWVFQIARHAVADHFRRKRDVQNDVDSLPTEVDFPGPENLNAEIARCVGALIKHLPEDQQRAVTMYELERLPQQEVAARESISISGAKSRIQRGRKKLEAMLLECCRFQLDARGNVLQYEAASEDGCIADRCADANESG